MKVSRLSIEFLGYDLTFNKREYELWKLPLNSSFCAVTADAKSRWPHGKNVYFRGVDKASSFFLFMEIWTSSLCWCTKFREMPNEQTITNHMLCPKRGKWLWTTSGNQLWAWKLIWCSPAPQSTLADRVSEKELSVRWIDPEHSRRIHDISWFVTL